MKREITAIYLLPGEACNSCYSYTAVLHVLILYSVICTRQRDQPLVGGTKIKAVTHQRGFLCWYTPSPPEYVILLLCMTMEVS